MTRATLATLALTTLAAGCPRPTTPTAADLRPPATAADAHARTANPIIDGAARFTVLADGLIRLEYAADGRFLDAPSFIALDRAPAGDGFSSDVRDGWRRITTARGTLRYRQRSGRFGADNLVLETTHDGRPLSAVPRFGDDGYCLFGHTCEAEAAISVGSVFGGGPMFADDGQRYSGQGYTGGWAVGSGLRWRLADLPRGAPFTVTIRYANPGAAGVLQYQLAGGANGSLTLAKTADADSWAEVSFSATAGAAVEALQLTCTGSANCTYLVDHIALGNAHTAAAPTLPKDTQALGGWLRGLDGVGAGKTLAPGLLSRAGWYLLDDSTTALFHDTRVPTQRPQLDADHQDGYLFLYDRDYRQALANLRRLTGASSLPPRWSFGVSYSRYFAFHDRDWHDLIAAARTHRVPLDSIVIDTDFRAPTPWNGWRWNPAFYPDPAAFAAWVKSEQLHLLYNIHPSIQKDDPDFATAMSRAGNSLVDRGNNTFAFDISRQSNVDAFLDLTVNRFNLQHGYYPWLDWCCDALLALTPGTPADSWLATLYAAQLQAGGWRGETWSRLGSGLRYYSDNRGAVTPGPWSDHRHIIHFTGDTQPTWDVLAFESQFTAAETSIGEAYVSHDIGSFHGKHLDDDMYVRWVQLGAFQPIFRVHSDHGDRLPWEYDDQAATPAADYFRLREALLPYVYTTAQQASARGDGMARPLWLTAPKDAGSYSAPTEYMFGDSLLIAPVIRAGTIDVPTTVYFPPGNWIGFPETHMPPAVISGPATRTVSTDLSSYPVFARAGAIVPLQPYADRGTVGAPAQLTLDVFAGADGSFALYEDEGDGMGYASGAAATTPIDQDEATRRLTIGARRGSYPGAPPSRSWVVRWIGVAAPSAVTVDGKALAAGEGTPDSFAYDAAARRLTITLAPRPTAAAVVISRR